MKGSRNLSRVAAMLYGAPLMVMPDKAAVIERVFQSHVMGAAPVAHMMEDDGPSESPEQKAERIHAERCKSYAGVALQRRDDKPYALTTSGIGIIPIHGTLMQRGSWMDAWSGLMGYDELVALVSFAANDSDVRAILLDIDSPGGQVNGAFEAAEYLAAVNKEKPVWGVATEQVYSAAYLQASSAARFYVPKTGGTGSIGTIAMHLDQTKRDGMMGYTYTVIHAGAQKADLNSHVKLSDRARAKLQSEVDRMNVLFLSHVAEHRNLSVEAVAATEAALLSPADALDAGLIDGVQTLTETVAMLDSEVTQGRSVFTGTRLAADPSTPAATTTQPETSMTTANQPAASATAPQTTTAPAAAAPAAAPAAAAAPSTVDAVAAERARIAGIMGCDEAKGRPKLAQHLAMETTTSLEDAKKTLAAAAMESAAPASGFNKAMGDVTNPAVGTGNGVDTTASAPVINTAAIYASRAQGGNSQH